MRTIAVGLLVLSCLFCAMTPALAGLPDDRIALQGLKSVKVIFDVRVPDQEKLLFNLQLIRETLQGVRQQKVRPQIIVTFRGPGVRLLTREQADSDVTDLMRELKAQGVRFEVCAVALRLFKAEHAPLMPEAVLVGNVLTSLIGYQNKGYALITLN